MNTRLKALNEWVATQLALPVSKVVQNMAYLAGDASFRNYFRLRINGKSYVLMDAPPEIEPSKAFLLIDEALAALGLSVPEIYASDLKQGFLLLSDLGDQLYFRILSPDNVNSLYHSALEALVILQTCKPIKNLPLGSYDEGMYTLEMERFVFWFLEQYLGLNLTTEQNAMLQRLFNLLIASALSQPQVFTHRDYHSRNLLWLPERTQQQQVGILDFQDSVWGAITYDAMSLLRDCYIAWPKKAVVRWALEFKALAWQHHDLKPVSNEQFMRWFDLMGVQRHLKATYIFARKFCRDQQKEYLADIPRTLHYVVEVCQDYSELTDLKNFIGEIVQPKLEQLL